MKNMKHRQQLYGGPLDGADVEIPEEMSEGWELEVDLTIEEYTPELRANVTKPRGGCVVHVLRNGVLHYLRQNHD